MYVPDEWSHRAPNAFVVCGYRYNSMAQWILVQVAASRYAPLSHYFNMSIDALPEVTEATEDILDRGLTAMFDASAREPFDVVDGGPDGVPLYVSNNKVLGIGISRLRHEFGDTHTGANMYGKAMHRVLSRRASSK